MHEARRFTDARTNNKSLYWPTATHARILSSCGQKQRMYIYTQTNAQHMRTDTCVYQTHVKCAYFSYFSYTPHC